MPYFRTTRRFAPGGRLGHDRICPCGVAWGMTNDRIATRSYMAYDRWHDRIGPCGHIIYVINMFIL